MISPLTLAPYQGHNNKDQLFLLIVVQSAVRNFRTRRDIRATWGQLAESARLAKKQRGDVKTIFLLGRNGNNFGDLEVRSEAERFGDILVEDFVDSYTNLTLKSTLMLKYLNRKPRIRAKYIFKVSDLQSSVLIFANEQLIES